MANKNNKKDKKAAGNLGGGISTKSYKPAAPKKKVEAAEPEKKGIISFIKGLSVKAKRIIAICLAAAILIGAAVPITMSIVEENRIKNFSYLESDLSRYIDFSAEFYKDYPLILDIAEPHEIDVQISLLSMLAADKGGKTIGGMTIDPTELTVGDDVYFWYRAYVLEDGREVDITSLMNFYKEESNIKSESNVITLGAGNFGVAGIEGGMIGLNTGDYAKFVKIKEGTVDSEMVVYISCERLPVGGSEADLQTGSCVRIDLTDEGNEKWIPIFENATIGHEVDNFTMDIDGKDYEYSKVKVEFATKCENGEGKPTLTLKGYAPYDYSITQLKNEEIYVEIYFAGVQKRNDWHNKVGTGNGEYDISFDWTNDYIEKKIADGDLTITMEELAEYDGETSTEKYESYVWEKIWENYEENLKQMTEDAMWEYYLDRAIIKEYPQKMVAEIFAEYKADVINQFNKSAGYIYNMYTGENVTCSTVDEYAIIYLSLQYAENQDWQDYLKRLSESLVAERLILYYIMRQENLVPSTAEFNERLEALKQEYVDEYIKQDSTDTSGYTEEEYEDYLKDVKKKLFDYYDDDYFAETTYYEMVVESMITYARVYTLDDIPARDRWAFDIVNYWI